MAAVGERDRRLREVSSEASSLQSRLNALHDSLAAKERLIEQLKAMADGGSVHSLDGSLDYLALNAPSDLGSPTSRSHALLGLGDANASRAGLSQRKVEKVNSGTLALVACLLQYVLAAPR